MKAKEFQKLMGLKIMSLPYSSTTSISDSKTNNEDQYLRQDKTKLQRR